MEPTAHKVTVLELFFDLIFVFAITQVTGFLAADLSPGGLGRGLLLIAALWWAWVAYSWLTNTLHAEAFAPRITVLTAMAAMLLVSLAVPSAFGRDAVVFAVAYAVVRALHVVLYYLAARQDPELKRGVVRLAAPLMIGSVILVGASFLSGTVRTPLWGAALLVDYAGPLLAGTRGWSVQAAHFVERHGLIVLIALGESIVSIGVGASGVALEPLVLGSALLAVVTAGGLYWAYFDMLALDAEHRLSHQHGQAQVAMARDAYSYLHLPMVAGIVLFALGVKKAIGHADHALTLVPSIALYGGLALHFVGHVVFRLRTVGTLSRPFLLLAAVFAGAIALGTRIPAVASLAGCAVLVCMVVGSEALAARRRRIPA
jgi:low temperature requirement protein LtrA